MSYAERAVIQVSRPVKAKLDALKTAQQHQLKRQVSISEIIEQLLDDRRALTRIGDAWQKLDDRWSSDGT